MVNVTMFSQVDTAAITNELLNEILVNFNVSIIVIRRPLVNIN